MSIVMISESLLQRATASDGRILRDRVLSGFGVRLNARKRIFLIATVVSGKQFRMMLGQWPLMSVGEARTKAMAVLRQCRAALAAAKAHGVVLGATGPANLKRTYPKQRQDAARAFQTRLKPVLDGFVAQGLTRRDRVAQLNNLGIKAPRGGTWSLVRYSGWFRLSDRPSLHLNLPCYPKVEEFWITEAG